jgi:hypothetical protein
MKRIDKIKLLSAIHAGTIKPADLEPKKLTLVMDGGPSGLLVNDVPVSPEVFEAELLKEETFYRMRGMKLPAPTVTIID